MLDWFYENLGSRGILGFYIIVFLVVIPIIEFINEKIPNLHGRARRLCAISGIVLMVGVLTIVLTESAFRYDYARRRFGDDFVQNTAWAQVNDRLDEVANWKDTSKSDSDRELYKSLFDWADDVNVNVPKDTNDTRKEAELYKLEVDSSFGKHRKHE